MDDVKVEVNGRRLCSGDMQWLQRQLRDGERIVAYYRVCATEATDVIPVDTEEEWHELREGDAREILGYFALPDTTE